MVPRLRFLLPLWLLLAVAVMSCQPTASAIILITATPASAGDNAAAGEPAGGGGSGSNIVPPSGVTPPGAAPTPAFMPTPNPTREAIISPSEDQVHVVQFGDTLNAIARLYGISPEAITEANQIPNPNLLEVGQALIIPMGIQTVGVSFKIIPDSELVYGPSLRGFSTQAAVEALPNSFLAKYQEELDGRLWSGAEIIERVALEQSINPRLLLALLEYESRWLSQPEVDEDAARFPMRYRERPAQIYGLYRQLDWAGKMLQVGYYGWRQRGLAATLLADGTRVGLDPTLNGGTAGVQVLLAQTRTLDSWLQATQYTGLFATYTGLFGDPFAYAVEPLIPPDLEQPPLTFPWDPSETWYFTGGPHGGWGSASAWASLDFVAAAEVGTSCEVSDRWARAMADGVIARSTYGMVILDLDGDGFAGTGWTIVYLHIASAGRPVVEGQRVRAGDPIGRPSCEGGVSFATHLHVGRRYNGEWIAADCSKCLLTVPSPQLNIDGWLAYSFPREYDGALIRGDEYREACVCREPLNTFGPPPAEQPTPAETP